MKNTITKVPTVSEFVEALNRLFENAETVCKMLVEMVEQNPKVYDEIIKTNPKLTYNFLGNLERVGRGQLYFGLLCDSSPGARKLITLPPSQQRAIYENPVRVVSNVNGKHVVSEKTIQQLSKQEAALLISDTGHVRTIEEQIKVVSIEPAAPPARKAQRYQIIGDRLRVMAETEFDVSTLRGVLEQMEANALNSLGASLNKNQIK